MRRLLHSEFLNRQLISIANLGDDSLPPGLVYSLSKFCIDSCKLVFCGTAHLHQFLTLIAMIEAQARFFERTTSLTKALLTAGLLGGVALSILGAGSAQAASDRRDCKFGGSTSMNPTCDSIDWAMGWTLEDKKLTNFSFDPAIPAGGPPSGVFSFIYDDLGAPGLSVEDMWTTLASFNPSLPPPSTGSYSYDLAIIEPGWMFKNVELDVVHAGSGQEVTKTIVGGGSPVLVSMDGDPVGPVPLSGTSISVTDSWDLDPATGTISAISNTYTQVPAPLPILGAGAAFGSIRKLRIFSSQLKTFSKG